VEAPGTAAGAHPRRAGKARGRPTGSIKLSPQSKALLIAAVEAGGTDHACARAAGVDPRTYRTWRAIAEGRHPTRKPTPELVALFREIDEAEARSRIKREIDVANRDPKTWLRYRAPSRPGLDGWTAPVPEDGPEDASPVYVPTPEEFALALRALVEATGLSLESCGDPTCPCPLHHQEEAHDQT
jgi:transposase